MIKLGHDLVNIERIRNLIEKYGNKFLHRIFTKNEILASGKFTNRDKSIAFLAKRFAAKEAFAKAVGTGIRGGLEFSQIEVLNNELGAPILNLHGKAKEIAEALDISDIEVSLSDEHPYCSAVVLIYSDSSKIFEKNAN